MLGSEVDLVSRCTGGISGHDFSAGGDGSDSVKLINGPSQVGGVSSSSGRVSSRVSDLVLKVDLRFIAPFLNGGTVFNCACSLVGVTTGIWL
jgi:hypothetical protein